MLRMTGKGRELVTPDDRGRVLVAQGDGVAGGSGSGPGSGQPCMILASACIPVLCPALPGVGPSCLLLCHAEERSDEASSVGAWRRVEEDPSLRSG